MLEQIMTLITPHIQLITAALILAVVVLELIHIGQTSRINKKLSRAGRWLQRYLNTVFSESTQESAEKEDVLQSIERYTGEDVKRSAEMDELEKARQFEVAHLPRSVQEENMRVSLERKKLKKDEEILDSVLQEIFD